MTNRQRNLLILLFVAGLLAASGLVIASRSTVLGLDLKGGVELVYEGTPTPQSKVTPAALQRSIEVMRSRVDQLGVSQPSIETTGRNDITVDLPDAPNVAQAEREVGQTATLYFFDWEANALTPNGQTVASQLPARDATALAISQGLGSADGPGSAGTGSTDLYSAIKLAESVKSPPIGRFNTHSFALYYLFAAPGSSACRIAAKDYAYTPRAGVRCYLAGPVTGAVASQPLRQLYAELPSGVAPSEAELMTVPRGVTVLAAIPVNLATAPKLTSPSTRFYTLLDRVSVLGSQITSPEAGTDSAGGADVTFGLTSKGAAQFQAVTATIAHRGELDSTLGSLLYQHFAAALGTQLITVPYINFNQFQDGIIGSSSEIDGSFTSTTAAKLANELRLGALPIGLRRISEKEISASLGRQSLNQGLVAGIVGLGVVVLFLLAYYRLLGLIAVGGLIVYGIYFYALIKLVPITMTLAGIAGLILTIGVAADANIVIFERVKEEIRAGRSIRQGIEIGYRKGLTAIIDANVVTITTAFILFVLATADVKGFAFTLGIGTFVSLFTAVLATQSILMTIGDSRLLSRPTALGAGGKKHVWRFDFMGASRYFFSMSGVILLIGALAIGVRGLNLGIDFTSGTQVTVGLDHRATQPQVISAMASTGVRNATVEQVIGDKALGPYGFQITSNQLPTGGRQAIENALQQRFGIDQSTLSYTSVGPSFGSTVAHSAIVAIVASLLVILAYIALRFSGKFAIPVLIALMHDLLITAGVYALTGRTVTADTVAALLTILGYSLYDTIIVFDRVRENIPRMPRAAFSQIVNRSMSEVLTRSLATTSCTLLPIIGLLLFGGTTLKDFAFALLIGVASGAYSSIFIAAPVLTHWKEREATYRQRRERLTAEFGAVPAYADGAGDVDRTPKRVGRSGRITQHDGGVVSGAEFEQTTHELGLEEQARSGDTSGLVQRLAHIRRASAPAKSSKPAAKPSTPADVPAPNGTDDLTRAPDVAENEGMAAIPSKARPGRRRKHGRR